MRMPALVLVTPSTEELISCVEMKDWLKVDQEETADDALIESLTETAILRLEDCYHRAFLQQVFDQAYDCTPDYDNAIRPMRSPLVDVVSIRTFGTSELTDSGGTVMSSTGYYVDTKQEPGRIVPVNVAWPSATREVNALIVRFTAGYSSTPAGVPERVKTDVKQLVARLYEHRGDEEATAKILAEYDYAPNDLSLPEWG